MARVFSGIQPSGELHIGNYLGAVQNWVKLQHEHDCLFCIVDLHAITQPYDVSTLAERTLEMAIGLFAAGLDPDKCIVFVQSHVAEHSELNWLLTTVAPLGELDGQTKMSKSLGNTIGLFESPEAIWEKLRPAATDPARVTRKDPGNPDICNIFTIHQGFSPPATQAEVAHKCRTAGWGCLDCKRVLADNMITALAPIRERAAALQRDPPGVLERLRNCANRARALAQRTIAEVRDKVGFLHGRS